MTKKRTLLLSGSLIAVLLLVGTAMFLWLNTDRTVLYGTALITDTKAVLVRSHDEFVELRVTDDTLLDGIETGDMLAIVQTTDADGNTITTDCIRLATESTTPATDLLQGERVSYSYGYAGVALTIPDGWDYSIKKYSENDADFGILFWPEGRGNGCNSYISVCYRPRFLVCGTGLQCKEAVIGGYKASIGTYMPSSNWNHITFDGTIGNYVATTCRVFDWWDEYSEQAMAILDTVTFAPDLPPMISADEAIARAEEMRTAQTYKNVYANFNHISGCWDVRYTNRHSHTIETIAVPALDIVLPENWGMF